MVIFSILPAFIEGFAQIEWYDLRGARRLMLALAELLPPEYRGVYADFPAPSEL